MTGWPAGWGGGRACSSAPSPPPLRPPPQARTLAQQPRDRAQRHVVRHVHAVCVAPLDVRGAERGDGVLDEAVRAVVAAVRAQPRVEGARVGGPRAWPGGGDVVASERHGRRRLEAADVAERLVVHQVAAPPRVALQQGGRGWGGAAARLHVRPPARLPKVRVGKWDDRLGGSGGDVGRKAAVGLGKAEALQWRGGWRLAAPAQQQRMRWNGQRSSPPQRRHRWEDLVHDDVGDVNVGIRAAAGECQAVVGTDSTPLPNRQTSLL